MKAIGKRSIASILAIALHVLRIPVWLGFAGLAASAEGVNVFADVDIEPGDYLEVLSHFVTFGVLLYVIDRLLELLKTLRFGSPFVAENAVRFRNIGFALLIGEASQILFSIFGHAFDAEIEGGIDLITLVSIAAVFVLAEIFREGARMKEEQDLTV